MSATPGKSCFKCTKGWILDAALTSPSVLACLSFPRAEAKQDLGHSYGITERVSPCGMNNLFEYVHS